MEAQVSDLVGWLPGKILWKAGEPTVVWRQLDPGEIREPYFDETLKASLSDAEIEGKSYHTPIAMLREVAEAPATEPVAIPAPAGFLFHWSRSGARMVAQMLAADYSHLVLNEFQPIDALLRCQLWDARATPEWRQEQLRWLILATARAMPHRSRLFVRFENWQILQLPVVQAAFPLVPWAFLYREPMEVLASHEHRCGSLFVPGELEPELFGWELRDIMRRPFAVHWAKVLAALGEAALAGLPAGHGYLLNHSELPEAAYEGLLKAFNVPRDPDLLAVMAKTARYHQRDPKTLSPDASLHKLRAELPDHAAAADAHVADVYHRLEAARNGEFGLPEHTGL